MGHKISKEQIDPGVKDHIMSFVGNKNELETSDKSDMVNAINSLIVDRIENINNITKLANSIGNPVTASDNVDEVCDKVNGLLSTFKTNMMNSGVMVEGTDKFKQLIDKIKGLTEGEGNRGIQYVSGSCEINQTHNYGDVTFNFTESLSFTPTYFFARIPQVVFTNQYEGSAIRNVIITNFLDYDKCPRSSVVDPTYVAISNITNTSFTIKIKAECISRYVSSDGTDDHVIDWYAIGVGEEDTTLRDSLASILEEEGVVVVPEDDMASLIAKTDEEFNKKNNTISGLEGEIANKNNTISGLEGDIKNNRDSLASILQDESVSVTTGDNLASLITKTDEEFTKKNEEIKNSRLNIISATELPSKVVENQICLITNSFGKVYIANELSTSTLSEGDVYIKNTTTGYYVTTHITTPVTDISLNLNRIVQIKSGAEKEIDAYVGINGQWVPTKPAEFYLFKQGTGLHSSVGGFEVTQSNGTYSVTTDHIGLIAYAEFSDITILSKNYIDVTGYSTIEVKASSSGYGAFTLTIGSIPIDLSNTEIAIRDISSLSGLQHLEITKGSNYQNQFGNIYYIKLTK